VVSISADALRTQQANAAMALDQWSYKQLQQGLPARSCLKNLIGTMHRRQPLRHRSKPASNEPLLLAKN
jgi:hypothetical protein